MKNLKRFVISIVLMLSFFGSVSKSTEEYYRKYKRDVKTRDQMIKDKNWNNGGSLPILLFGGTIIVVIFTTRFLIKKTKKHRNKQKIEKLIFDYPVSQIEVHKEEYNNLINEWEKYSNMTSTQFDFRLNKIKALNAKYRSLVQKYNSEIAGKLVYEEYWIGMTKEQLIDGRGEPTKIEIDVLKTKTKTTYIYGNKSSGDIFVLEDDIVVKFKDR